MIYKLRDWINIKKLDLSFLAHNPNVIEILQNNIDEINDRFLWGDFTK